MSIVGAHLQIRGLSVVYDGEIAAVDGIHLDVEPGEFVTLLGPSGSGKTSILMAIAGFIPPAGGQVLVDSANLLERPPNERNLGLVVQSYALFPHMTVAQNIAFPLKMRKQAQPDIDTAVEQALKMVRLDGYQNRKPGQLSGGEQQRVALARATVFDPPLLLMDEPLGALDRQLRDQLQRELKSIQQRTGITTLYVTHDQDEAMTISDRIAIMRDGRIEQIDTPAELYERPRNTFVAGFLGESNVLRGVVHRSGTGVEMETEAGWRFPLADPGDLANDQAVHVQIRPERIVLDDSSADVKCPAEIIDWAFGGEMIRLTIRVPGGDELLVKRQNLASATCFQSGQQVTIGWSLHDMTVLRD